MILSQSEVLEIKEIMGSYKNLHDSLDLYEKNLESISTSETDPGYILELGSKIRSCVDKLAKEREKESLLYRKLEEKYGPGELDVMTLEYKTVYEKTKI